MTETVWAFAAPEIVALPLIDHAQVPGPAGPL